MGGVLARVHGRVDGGEGPASGRTGSGNADFRPYYWRTKHRGQGTRSAVSTQAGDVCTPGSRWRSKLVARSTLCPQRLADHGSENTISRIAKRSEREIFY